MRKAIIIVVILLAILAGVYVLALTRGIPDGNAVRRLSLEAKANGDFLDCVIRNPCLESVSYGAAFSLEWFNGKSWEKRKPDPPLSFELWLNSIPPLGRAKISYPLSAYSLDRGSWRVRVTVTGELFGITTLYGEFNVE